MVGGVTTDPRAVVKAATTLDVLSGAAALLGIGAFWNETSRVRSVSRFRCSASGSQMLERRPIAHEMWQASAAAEGGVPAPFHATRLMNSRNRSLGRASRS